MAAQVYTTNFDRILSLLVLDWRRVDVSTLLAFLLGVMFALRFC